MKLTSFTFFKDTPLVDFQNTIHFKSNSERDAFFLEGAHYVTLDVTKNKTFNFIKDRSSLQINVDYNNMRGVNYCTFYSDFEDIRYYAYVLNYEYVSPNLVNVNLLIDGIMTFTQGKWLQTLTNLTITRQHLPLSEYNHYAWELKNNGDIIKSYTKNYFKTESLKFEDLIVVMKSSANLQADYGTVDDPNVRTSNGNRFDKVTSPLNLYACDIDDFNRLMTELSPYPWISQNITSLSLIPRIFMDDNLQSIQFSENETLSGVTYLYKVSGNGTNKSDLIQDLNTLSYDMTETYELFDLDPIQDKHLLRSEYTTAELYNYSGGSLFIDTGQLNSVRGLDYQVDIITGYENDMKIYLEGYRVNGGITGQRQGAYVNDSLSFNQFDDIPMLINNATLSLANSANQRALAETKLVTNRVQNVVDPKANLQDRFFNAASLISNVSVNGLFGKFSDEYEFYRTQKAEQADLALQTPSVTNQTNGNSFNIANNMFGIHFKYSKPTTSEMNKIKKYYKLFGYQINDNSNTLSDVESMTICNYLQFSGSWFIYNTDVALNEMMKAQFENGVRFWHNNETANPMNQNVLNNEMVV